MTEESTDLQKMVNTALEASGAEDSDQLPSLKTLVNRIESRGRVERIAVSKSFKAPGGSIFCSRTASFTEVDEHGNEVGGLDKLEADIAVQLVSLRVEQDSIRRALSSEFITKADFDGHMKEASVSHARMMKQLYEAAK